MVRLQHVAIQRSSKLWSPFIEKLTGSRFFYYFAFELWRLSGKSMCVEDLDCWKITTSWKKISCKKIRLLFSIYFQQFYFQIKNNLWTFTVSTDVSLILVWKCRFIFQKKASKTVPRIVRILASFLNLFSYPIIVFRDWYVYSRRVWLKTFGLFYKRGLKISYISTALTKTNDACQVAPIANEFTIRACTSCILVAYKRSSRIAL